MAVSAVLGMVACRAGGGRVPPETEVPSPPPATHGEDMPETTSSEPSARFRTLAVYGYDHSLELHAIDERGDVWIRIDAVGEVPGRLHVVDHAPAFSTLDAAGRTGVCGLTDEGALLCGLLGKWQEVELPRPAVQLRRWLVQLDDGRWLSHDGERAQELPVLQGLEKLFVGTDGCVVTDGPRGWRVFRGSGSPQEMAQAFQSATPLPFLDGETVTGVDAVGRCRGCAVLDGGAMRCWNRDGSLDREHAADGRAQSVRGVSLPGYQFRFCAGTADGVICDDPQWPEDTDLQRVYTMEVGEVSALSFGEGVCFIAAGGRIGCLDASTVDAEFVRVPLSGEATSVSYNEQGACATLRSGAVVCWGRPFEHLHQSPVQRVISEHYPRPTTIFDDGVDAFLIESSYGGWCSTSSDGVRCEPNRKGQLEGFLARVDGSFVCQAGQGHQDCEPREEQTKAATCQLRGGEVWCRGSRKDGFTGQPWSRTGIRWFSETPDEAP